MKEMYTNTVYFGRISLDALTLVRIDFVYQWYPIPKSCCVHLKKKIHVHESMNCVYTSHWQTS